MASHGFSQRVLLTLQAIRFGKRYGSYRFAKNYDWTKSFEDWNDNLVPVLSRILPLRDATVADVGTGTGQVALKLAPVCKHVHAFDAAEAMIRFANLHKPPAVSNVTFAIADARRIPLPDHAVDMAIYPWSLTSILSPAWDDNWRDLLTSLLAEARRIVRPHGMIAIIETINLRNELPWGEVWHPKRREFLSFLETDLAFTRQMFSNDWNFEDTKNLRRFGPILFAPKMLRTMIREGTTVLEECAGIWLKSV